MTLHRISLLLIFLFLTACGGGGGSGSDSSAKSGEVLYTGVYSQGGQVWNYQNLKLINEEGGYTYAQFFKASGLGPHPVIVLTRPYAGIDWSGEEVDSRWASEYMTHLAGGGGSSMCVPDVDGPNYTILSSGDICYFQMTAEQAGDEAYLFLLNNFSVLVVYGRFYAGGDVANDIADMIAGLKYLGTLSYVDTSRIGITGNSWGGFEALYAALHAPLNVKPSVAVPVYPVTDFSLLENFIRNELPALVTAPVLSQYYEFYDPYLRRLYATTGEPPAADYTGYTFADLAPLVDFPMLIFHDDGDTILPAELSHQFVSSRPDNVEGFWYKRSDTPPWETVVTSHGEINNALVVQPYYTFASAYLMLKLASATQSLLVPYGELDMQIFMNDIYTYQTEGRDVDWLVSRLVELTDSRVTMVDITPASIVPETSGAQWVAERLNNRWGTTLTAATVVDWLINNGLPTP